MQMIDIGYDSDQCHDQYQRGLSRTAHLMLNAGGGWLICHFSIVQSSFCF